MKKTATFVLFVSAMFIVLALFSCGSEYSTWLELEILQQPSGGTNMTTVTCLFRGRLVDGNSPITATVEWWRESEPYVDSTCIKSDQWIFDETNWQPMSAIYSADLGHLLSGYYWTKVIWENANGYEQELSSNKAFFSVYLKR